MLTTLLLAVTLTFHVSGFDKPESAYWDPGTKSWYVSSIIGSETEKDGKGWISAVDPDGKVRHLLWLTKLNAPKGIGVYGGTLYVADIDEVVLVDMAARKVKTKIAAPGAKFLNDVAIGPKGEVYVSDTMTNAIYRCTDSACEVFVSGRNLEGPNGLLVDGNRLVVAAFGIITDPATFKTEKPGRLLAVDLKTKKVTPLGDGKPIGNLDGLEKDGEDFIVTDYMAGKLMRISKTGTVTLLQSGFKNSADIGYDTVNRTLAVPEMGAGALQLFALQAEKPAPKAPASKAAEKSKKRAEKPKKPASRR